MSSKQSQTHTPEEGFNCEAKGAQGRHRQHLPPHKVDGGGAVLSAQGQIGSQTVACGQEKAGEGACPTVEQAAGSGQHRDLLGAASGSCPQELKHLPAPTPSTHSPTSSLHLMMGTRASMISALPRSSLRCRDGEAQTGTQGWAGSRSGCRFKEFGAGNWHRGVHNRPTHPTNQPPGRGPPPPPSLPLGLPHWHPHPTHPP